MFTRSWMISTALSIFWERDVRTLCLQNDRQASLEIETKIGLRQREREVGGNTQRYCHQHEYQCVTLYSGQGRTFLRNGSVTSIAAMD